MSHIPRLQKKEGGTPDQTEKALKVTNMIIWKKRFFQEYFRKKSNMNIAAYYWSI